MCTKCSLVNLSVNLDDLEPELRRVAKLIYAGKLEPGQIDAKMTALIAEQLMQGVFKGYGKSLSSEDLTAAERSFLTLVQDNIYVFSGFKNHQQLKEASLLLLDGEGSFKPFNTFLNDVKKIDETYNEVYLNAEYSNALASSQNAAAWQDFVNNGIDMLMFQTANDDRVRNEHVILNGLIVSIDDPLLDKYFTPLDWGCRCEWIPAPGEKPSGYSDQELPKIPPMFQNNVGKTGIIFPETHPYYKVQNGIAEKILEQVAAIERPKAAAALEDDEPRFTPKRIAKYEKELGVNVDRKIFAGLKKETPLFHRGDGAAYNPNNNSVRIPIGERVKRSKWGAESVVYHEYGHAVDWHKGLRAKAEVKDLMTKYKGIYGDKLHDLGIEMHRESARGRLTQNWDLTEKAGALADTIMALNPQHGFGHSQKYFSIPGKREGEFIAHAFENRFAGNDIFKKFMPDLYEDMIKLIDSFIKPE